jgi:integrase/recombinase XerD
MDIRTQQRALVSSTMSRPGLLDRRILRISEALDADIGALGIERGHRTLTALRERGKFVTKPLASRTARAIDLAIGDGLDGPFFLRPDGRRPDRETARPTGRHQQAGWLPPCGMRSSPPPSTPASPPCDLQEAASYADPTTTMRYERARVSFDRHATYIVAAYLAGAAR